MASHNGSFEAWMLDLISGVDKLHVLVDSTFADLERWERGLFKVLEAQGILHHVNQPESFSTRNSASSHAERALALALLKLTIHGSVKDNLTQPTGDTGDARLVHAEIRRMYMEFIEWEKSYEIERAEKRVQMRAYHREKKEVVESILKQKKNEIVKLEEEVVDLEQAIERTYLPEWAEW